MSAPTLRQPGFRVSLRELLALVAAGVVACVALKYANSAWLTAVQTIALVAMFAAVVVALVDRGPQQAFAIGFVVCCGGYGYLLQSHRTVAGGGGNTFTTNPEMQLWDGSLPTTKVLRFVYDAISEPLYVRASAQSGNGGFLGAPGYRPPTRLRASQLPKNASIQGEGQRGNFGDAIKYTPSLSSGNVYVLAGSTLDSETFPQVGHWLWALALGYCGGHFGRFVHARRVREQQAPQK